MLWIIAEYVGLPHLTHFETVVDLFHHGFNQNEILEMRVGALVRSCNLPLLPIHTLGNFRRVDSEDGNARRRHLDLRIVEANSFHRPNSTVRPTDLCLSQAPNGKWLAMPTWGRIWR